MKTIYIVVFFFMAGCTSAPQQIVGCKFSNGTLVTGPGGIHCVVGNIDQTVKPQTDFNPSLRLRP